MEEQNSFKASLNKYLSIEPELNLLNKPWNDINNKEDFFKIFETDLSSSVFDPEDLDHLVIESRTTYYLINSQADFNDLYQITEKHFLRFRNGIIQNNQGFSLVLSKNQDYISEFQQNIFDANNIIIGIYDLQEFTKGKATLELSNFGDLFSHDIFYINFDRNLVPVSSIHEDEDALIHKKHRKSNGSFQLMETIQEEWEIESIEEFFSYKFHTLENLIISFDLFSKKMLTNIRLKDKKNRIRFKCYCPECPFTISYINDGMDLCPDIKTYKQHTCQNDTISYIWVPNKITRLYLMKKYNITSAEQFNSKFSTTISKRIISYSQNKLNDKNMVNQLMIILKQYKDNGSEVICPLFKRGDNIVLHYFYIIPKHILEYMKSDLFFNLLCIDGSYLCFSIKGELISINTITPNNNYLQLGFGWAVSESAENIIPFLEMIKSCIEESPSFILDQGAGLNAAINQVFDHFKKRFCSFHLSKKYHFLPKLLELETKDDFDSFLSSKSLQQESINIILTTSRFYNPILSLNHTTNNSSEVINSLFKQQNPQNIFQVIDYCYNSSYQKILSMAQFSEENTSLYNDFAFSQISSFKSKLGEYEAQEVAPHTYNVINNITNKSFRVTFGAADTYACSCSRPLETNFPCIHVLKVLQIENKMNSLGNYVHKMYLKTTILNFVNNLEQINVTPTTYKTKDDVNFPLYYIPRKEKRKE